MPINISCNERKMFSFTQKLRLPTSMFSPPTHLLQVLNSGLSRFPFIRNPFNFFHIFSPSFQIVKVLPFSFLFSPSYETAFDKKYELEKIIMRGSVKGNYIVT